MFGAARLVGESPPRAVSSGLGRGLRRQPDHLQQLPPDRGRQRRRLVVGRAAHELLTASKEKTMLPRAFGRAIAALVFGAVMALASAGAAHANPRPLPYTYIYETLPKGDAEIEQYADLTPLRVISPNDARLGTWRRSFRPRSNSA